MKKAIDRIEALAPTVNLVLEVKDARAPLSTRCDILSRALHGCARVTILTKSDIADKRVTPLWLDHFAATGAPAVVFPHNQPAQRAKFITSIKHHYEIATSTKLQIKALVLGLPNVGKSTVLNYLAAKKSAPTGAVPGITRGVHLINIGHDFLVIDTPGLVNSNVADTERGLTLAAAGCLQENQSDAEQTARHILNLCYDRYSRHFDAFYNITSQHTSHEEFFEAIARRRGFLLKGGTLDLEHVYPLFARDIITGRIHGVSFELPPA